MDFPESGALKSAKSAGGLGLTVVVKVGRECTDKGIVYYIVSIEAIKVFADRLPYSIRIAAIQSL